ncbi:MULTISPECIES: hypothetical protein [Bradyrhizobium]|jgi:hypothetical protein|nr:MULTISPECIES: hypothetical protein [Bradyrhizobium]
MSENGIVVVMLISVCAPAACYRGAGERADHQSVDDLAPTAAS